MNITIPSRTNAQTSRHQSYYSVAMNSHDSSSSPHHYYITKPTGTTNTKISAMMTSNPSSSSSSSSSTFIDDNHTCVDVKCKSEYYDNDRILSKWGFTDNICHNCHKRNSDLHGLLMQCAKCKKAYYCSMKCFNDHLPEHQKFCTTKEIYSEPKGKASPFEFQETKEPIIETFTESDTKINFNHNEDDEEEEDPTNERIPKIITNRQPNNDTEVVYDEYEEEEVSEYEIDDDSIVGYVVDAAQTTDTNELDLQSSMKSLSFPDIVMTRPPSNYHQSCSDLAGLNQNRRPNHMPPVDGSDSWKMEEVDLRHTEQIKNHYSWSTPDWVLDRRLRPTSRGHIIQNGTGDIISPVTNAKILIDQGIITWKVPDWTNPKLRKTPRGEQIKRTSSAFVDGHLS